MSECAPTWEIEKPFVKFNQVAGLHVRIDGQHYALHFSSIKDRLEAQYAALEKELADLWVWWQSPDTPHDEANTQLYAERNELCLAERRQLERLWLEVQGYMPKKELA